MHVVATAGHVDHGKSTLVRALTGMEPDRWAEEKRRGLTIDLGFAWTTLGSGSTVSFVDVPGHERFLGNMLAGLGPSPVVCFVVAVDEGWQPQSSDHRDAVAALGIRNGMIVLTKADLAPERVQAVSAQVRTELGGTGLENAPIAVVSATTGAGLDDFRAALDHVLAAAPAPSASDRLRLWVDRAFSARGAGTIVTGTLGAGALRVEDQLTLHQADGSAAVSIRGLQSHHQAVDRIGPVTRAAVNLRGISSDRIHRGDVLLSPGAWPLTREFDARRSTGPAFTDVPTEVVVHIGSAALPARLRTFDGDHARLRLDRPMPLVPGDRVVLRYPTGEVVLGGAHILDVEPQALTRRGDGTRHTAWLAALPDDGDARAHVLRRGAVTQDRLERLGLTMTPDARILRIGDWWVSETTYERWAADLRAAVEKLHERDPLAPGMSMGAAADLLGIADHRLVRAVIDATGLTHAAGRIAVPGRNGGLGTAERAIGELEARCAAHPFEAPEASDLHDLGLGPRELAAAERAGRLLRLGGGVVVGPRTPALAMRELSRLEQPFTTSQARQALGTTRRVAIPLLEHLDTKGWTVRLDGTHRKVAGART